jgi:transcriptional regulator with XRE-family HTH domain
MVLSGDRGDKEVRILVLVVLGNEKAMLSDERRREIAMFLRTRRARLKPDELGLPPGGRRRTPGLRREEVAALAGVSTEWYTWLEQARQVRASAEALERIAGALRLEPSASRHLLTLAGYGTQVNGDEPSRSAGVSPHVQRLLDRLDPYPAWVYGERWDVVAWNRGACAIYGDFAAVQGLERNMLAAFFLNPVMRRMLVDWPRVARGVVAKVRSVYARYVDDPWYHEVLDLLCAKSPEFAAWWRDHEVHPYQDGVKVFDHAEAGRLTTSPCSICGTSDSRISVSSRTCRNRGPERWKKWSGS